MTSTASHSLLLKLLHRKHEVSSYGTAVMLETPSYITSQY